MKRIYLLFLLFLIGCTFQSATPGSSSPYKGTQGLEFDFLNLEDEYYERSEIQLGVIVSNKGGSDIEEGRLILGLERNIFPESSHVLDIDLEGKESLPQGNSLTHFFEIIPEEIQLSEKQKTRAVLTACYPHKIILEQQVCIDSDFQGLREDKPSICPPRPISFFGGQGGPVVISSVDTKMVPTSDGVIPQFEFEVENVGDGFAFDVHLDDAIEKACGSEGLPKEAIGVIDVSNVKLGNEVLTCTNNQLKVENRKDGNDFYQVDVAKIRCTGEEIPSSQTAYPGFITMTLSYGYKESLTEEFFVVKP